MALGGNTLGQAKNMSPSACNVSSQDVNKPLLIIDTVKEVADATMNKGDVPSDAPITDKSNGTMMPLQMVLVPEVDLNAIRVHQGAPPYCSYVVCWEPPLCLPKHQANNLLLEYHQA
jgi:hypothetical protein